MLLHKSLNSVGEPIWFSSAFAIGKLGKTGKIALLEKGQGAQYTPSTAYTYRQVLHTLMTVLKHLLNILLGEKASVNIIQPARWER